MKENKKVLLSVMWVVIGGLLIALGVAEKIDEYWSGMGGSLLMIGVLQLLRYNRLKNNEE